MSALFHKLTYAAQQKSLYPMNLSALAAPRTAPHCAPQAHAPAAQAPTRITRRDQRRVGSLVRCSGARLLLHDDRRADLDPVIEIDHVLIGHANATR
jgi:hypothetical protein